MRSFAVARMMLVFLATEIAGAADAPQEDAATARRNIDLAELIELAAAQLRKTFIIDPQARGPVIMINVDPRHITYQELQTILSMNGLVATRVNASVVRIVPVDRARQSSTPVLPESAANGGDEEVVTRTLEVGSLSAAALVPLLRPLLPPQAHLAAHAETNTLIVAGRRASVRMVEAVVRDLRALPKHAAQP